ncbi:MAG: BspA family leucine-rich repeat surface protein [Lachnospiraceae bacterium]|nr:BspA family leucine-rich repeat surface protein [Lachnospiraceae bacterium]
MSKKHKEIRNGLVAGILSAILILTPPVDGFPVIDVRADEISDEISDEMISEPEDGGLIKDAGTPEIMPDNPSEDLSDDLAEGISYELPEEISEEGSEDPYADGEPTLKDQGTWTGSDNECDYSWKLFSDGEVVIEGAGPLSGDTGTQNVLNLLPPWARPSRYPLGSANYGEDTGGFAEEVKKITLKAHDVGERGLFCNPFGSYVEIIDLSQSDLSDITDCTGMFGGCKKLRSVILPEEENRFRPTNMRAMFYGCESFEALDLSNLDTSGVTNMNSCFDGCTSLKNVRFGDTKKVKEFTYAFLSCHSLTATPGLDTDAAVSMYGMFMYCTSLKSFDFSGFKMDNVLQTASMFENCTGLESVSGLPEADTSSLSSARRMFYNCTALTDIDLEGFTFKPYYPDNVEAIYNGGYIYVYDPAGRSQRYDRELNSFSEMFSLCRSLERIDLSGFDLSNITGNSYLLFADCMKLTWIKTPDPQKVNSRIQLPVSLCDQASRAWSYLPVKEDRDADEQPYLSSLILEVTVFEVEDEIRINHEGYAIANVRLVNGSNKYLFPLEEVYDAEGSFIGREGSDDGLITYNRIAEAGGVPVRKAEKVDANGYVSIFSDVFRYEEGGVNEHSCDINVYYKNVRILILRFKKIIVEPFSYEKTWTAKVNLKGELNNKLTDESLDSSLALAAECSKTLEITTVYNKDGTKDLKLKLGNGTNGDLSGNFGLKSPQDENPTLSFIPFNIGVSGGIIINDVSGFVIRDYKDADLPEISAFIAKLLARMSGNVFLVRLYENEGVQPDYYASEYGTSIGTDFKVLKGTFEGKNAEAEGTLLSISEKGTFLKGNIYDRNFGGRGNRYGRRFVQEVKGEAEESLELTGKHDAVQATRTFELKDEDGYRYDITIWGEEKNDPSAITGVEYSNVYHEGEEDAEGWTPEYIQKLLYMGEENTDCLRGSYPKLSGFYDSELELFKRDSFIEYNKDLRTQGIFTDVLKRSRTLADLKLSLKSPEAELNGTIGVSGELKFDEVKESVSYSFANGKTRWNPHSQTKEGVFTNKTVSPGEFGVTDSDFSNFLEEVIDKTKELESELDQKLQKAVKKAGEETVNRLAKVCGDKNDWAGFWVEILALADDNAPQGSPAPSYDISTYIEDSSAAPLGSSADGKAPEKEESFAATVGNPYIISVIDQAENRITDWQGRSLTLELGYTEEDLNAAGVTLQDAGNLAIYRYSEELMGYLCCGGSVDRDRKKVTLRITEPGQYILAIDHAAPKITAFRVWEENGTPAIVAAFGEVSGFSKLSLKLDGKELVNLRNMKDYYFPEYKAIFVPIGDLSSGTHTATLYAADLAGNAMPSPMELKIRIGVGNGDVIGEDIPDGGEIPEGLWVALVPEPGNEEGSYAYTGSAVKPEVRIYDHTKLLRAGKDYTLKYVNNRKAYTLSEGDPGFFNSKKKTLSPAVIVTGKGNYSGKETVYFKILPAGIGPENEEVSVDALSVAYNKKGQKPLSVLTRNGKKLKKDTDYTVSYFRVGDGGNFDPETPGIPLSSVKEPGNYMIRYTGKKNFTGSRDVPLTILDNSGTVKLLNKLSFSKIADQPYAGGDEIRPALTIRDGAKELTAEDFTVTYRNNTIPGTGYAIVTGIPERGYSGTKRISFRIVGRSLKGAVLSGIPKEGIPYSGKPAPLDEMLRSGQIRLIAKDGTPLTLFDSETGTGDYTVSYSGIAKAGKAKATFIAKNGCSGKITKTFKIAPYSLNGAGIEVAVDTDEGKIPYAKDGAKASVTVSRDGTALKEGKDYTLTYRNHKAAGKTATVTIKGKGNYSGIYDGELSYQVEKQNLENLTLLVSDRTRQNRKNAYGTKFSIRDQNGKTLKAGTDYERTVFYKMADGSDIPENTVLPAGTELKVVIRGMGNYEGICEGNYRITKKSLNKAKCGASKKNYTGDAIFPDESDITVKIGGKKIPDTEIINGKVITNWEIVEGSCRNNVNKGKATVTIRGVGNYGGRATVTFTIGSKGFSFWKRGS